MLGQYGTVPARARGRALRCHPACGKTPFAQATILPQLHPRQGAQLPMCLLMGKKPLVVTPDAYAPWQAVDGWTVFSKQVLLACAGGNTLEQPRAARLRCPVRRQDSAAAHRPGRAGGRQRRLADHDRTRARERRAAQHYLSERGAHPCASGSRTPGLHGCSARMLSSTAGSAVSL